MCVPVVQQRRLDALNSAGAFILCRSNRAEIQRASLRNPPRTSDRIRSASSLTVSSMTESQRILDAAQQRARQGGLPYFGAVTPTEAHALISAVPNAQLIDVRTRAEWDYVGRVPGSFLIEWNSYPDGRRNPRFLDELRQHCADPTAPVLFLCRSGHRSDGAARAATAAGYAMAFNVLEGFEGDRDSEGHRGTVGGWRKARLPWVQG